MIMIKIKCFTNTDAFKSTDWPENFCIEPKIGHMVQEIHGTRSLKICNITHVEGVYTHGNPSIFQYLKIELTGKQIQH